ncbi:hypothetical protein COLO4_06019 [Corchorus olitorius]|uniref:DUF4216 domain-containing protein n=1 Tax=Corchorus olitorius TaxID=93759 RepID=A0A1R3KP87_9ROSI|nr:hypothetical protein COLO4_06019 [Corchorus olitorius]
MLHIHMYCAIVQNSDHIVKIDYLEREGYSSTEIDAAVDMNFTLWFKQFVEHEDNGIIDHLLCSLAWYPSRMVTSWSGYYVNGYKFHTTMYGDGKEVLQVEYLGGSSRKVDVLFNCDWFDPSNGMKIHPTYKLVDVHKKKLYKKFDPFVLAQQAIQVFYSEFFSLKKDKVDWMAVCEAKSKRVIESTFNDHEEDTTLQVDEVQQMPAVIITEQGPQLFDPKGINLTIDFGDLHEVHEQPVNCTNEDEFEDGSSYSDDDDDSSDGDY